MPVSWPGYPTSAQVSAEAYFDSVLANQFAYMLEAVLEGASGAPTVGEAALTPPAGASTTYYRYSTNPYGFMQCGITTTSYAKYFEMIIPRDGTYSTRLCVQQNSGTTAGRIYKNGVAYGTERVNTGATPLFFNEDLSFTAGDLLQVYAYRSGVASNLGFDIGFYDMMEPFCCSSGYGSL